MYPSFAALCLPGIGRETNFLGRSLTLLVILRALAGEGGWLTRAYLHPDTWDRKRTKTAATVEEEGTDEEVTIIFRYTRTILGEMDR